LFTSSKEFGMINPQGVDILYHLVLLDGQYHLISALPLE